MVSLFVEYVKFCSFTMKFVHRKPFYAVMRIGWSGQRAELTKLLRSIVQHKKEMDAAANVAHFSVSEARHGELVTLETHHTTNRTNFKVLRYPKNRIFYDRRDILEKVDAALMQDPSINLMRFLGAETEEKLFQDFGTICQCLGLESQNIPEDRKLRELVKTWLSENRKIVHIDVLNAQADVSDSCEVAAGL
ncbi:hypothetical protein DL95DRAFT_419031 [Leptodontidium sp. 2 PMI_412]|nr:hypothetical protein DL95DRAFT_419031 [Leptodontidium sp. 2 PMI_412]